MEKNKIKLDRIKVSSEEIKSKQNFDEILSKYNQTKAPVTKNPWFWGSAGLASFGVIAILTLNAFSEFKPVVKSELESKSTAIPEDTKCIKPPLKDKDVESTKVQFNNSKDEKIILKTGTEITIEKESVKLLNSSNNLVTLEVREFCDHAERFLSGIPLDNGDKAFESAGMIEIKGKQNGKEVEIVKPIKVSLVTNQDASSFKLWKLNEQDSKWVEHSKIAQNSHSQKKSVKNVEQKLNDIFQQIDEKQAFLNKMLIPTKTDYLIPEQNLPKFNLDFDKAKYPELANFSKLIFQAQTNNTAEFNKNRKKTWSSIDLIKKSEHLYIAHFKSKSENYSIEVRPILQGKELEQAEKEFDKALSEYKLKKNILSKEREELLKEKKKVQIEINKLLQNETENFTKNTNNVIFEINSWGVYNSDNETNYPKASNSDFVFLWNNKSTVHLKQLFVFDTEKNIRFNYGEGYRSIENLGFESNKKEFHLICLDREDNLGYCYYDETKGNVITFKAIHKDESLLELLKKLFHENNSIG